MLNTREAIANLLQDSFLKTHDIRKLEIDESDQFAFAIQIDRSRALEAWQLMRSRLEQTHRYPVLTEGWGSDDFFSRFYYGEEVSDGKLPSTSPESIIADAAVVDLEAFLAGCKAASRQYLEDSIDYSLAGTREQFSACPDRSQIRALIDNGTIHSEFDFEKWLLNWEVQNYGADQARTAPDTSYLEWFEPDQPTLLLLPIDNGWDALAYLHWYGACSAGTPVAIRFLKKWYQQYQAELVCHYGTMLQFQVGNRPTCLEEAFELAWEQVALAECTTILPGISLRNHARSLLAVDRWFLHERP